MLLDRQHRFDALCAYLIVALFCAGCTSVMTRAPDGRPRLFGLGSVQELETKEGRVFRVTAPGISLRLGSHWGGWTLGLHETLVFLAADADGDPCPDPVAIQTRAYGIDLTPNSVSVGFARTFAIPNPKKGSIIQMVVYSEDQPEATIVRRKEVQ